MIFTSFKGNATLISSNKYINGETYIGQLSESPLVTKCDGQLAFELGFMFFEHPINGSLLGHLQDPSKSRCITWEQRLKICLGAARGLKCLHSGLWEENRVVHRCLRSEFILLDENMDAKISEFSLSILVSRNNPQLSDEWKLWNPGYDYKDYEMDPIYKESYIVNTEVDVYSFGVVMFEILSGLTTSKQTSITNNDDANAYTKPDDDYGYYYKKKPNLIKRNHGATDFTTTIQCHQHQKLEDFLIPLKEISLATSDFSKNYRIGDGGFGVVYKGRLSEHWLHHQNITPFVGYCDEGDELILVCDYANNGSLDHHLQDPNKRRQLTRTKRFNICLGAAKGLDYVHSGLGEDNKVIHRDVKSGNILLDDNLEAKIFDFGLSKSDSPTNQQQTKLYKYHFLFGGR
ncbi:death-associated protein kinase 1 [Artemisia annua]|uniref:Death-associated protein kinase 1 n=1 Tax=Artemisia annua TaxID=35608 RepID=A0A2U1PJU0_ARTAN|nr:death-associated protein kinase 1 [Artemisia annua]